MDPMLAEINLLKSQMAEMAELLTAVRNGAPGGNVQGPQQQQQVQFDGSASAGRMDEDRDDDGEDARHALTSGESDEIDDTLLYSDLLGSSASVPIKQASQQLCTLLENPPPVELLGRPDLDIRFSKIPQTPAPRNNRVDRQLYQPQKKMEKAMNLLVQQIEKGDQDHRALALAATCCRSAWEDLQQHRRSLYAGKAAHALPRRPDDQRPRLLTPEEEEKIRKVQRPTKPRSRSFWGEATSSNSSWGKGAQNRNRSNSRQRGKGKGKGNKQEAQ